MTKFNINTVAIIGAGPGGLASLYELLHTNGDGTSTVGGAKSKNPKFTRVVVFEQKDKAGGIWSPPDSKADLPLPPQDLLNTELYANPDIINPGHEVPDNLTNTSLEKPHWKQINQIANELEWKRSGVFPDLFTNVPSRFTRFSYLPTEKKFFDKARVIYPFLSHKELSQRFDDFIDREELDQYVRQNSRVEGISKTEHGKWCVTVKHTIHEGNEEEWYQEEFDAVIIANGHYTVPNIPHIPGLAEYNKKYPGIIIHSKSYRDPKIFKDKKVLVVGGSFSSANLLQYIFPIAGSTYVSKRGNHLIFPWVDSAIESQGINVKPTIDKFISETNEILFSDGTTEKNFEVILLATGYHFHYPFLTNYLSVIDPSNLSRVSGLYYDTFAIKDPTLAAVGVVVSTVNFHTIEASAAAIAGVWSNAKTLPTTEEKRSWERQQVANTVNNLFFHYYPHDRVKVDFIDKLHVFASNGRYNPIEEDSKYLNEIDEGIKILEELFYKIKERKLTIEETSIKV